MIRFSTHAEAALSQRGLRREWVELAVTAPDWTEPDPADPTLVRAFKRLEDCDGRILRVVHRPQAEDSLIITAFLDRGARR